MDIDITYTNKLWRALGRASSFDKNYERINKENAFNGTCAMVSPLSQNVILSSFRQDFSLGSKGGHREKLIVLRAKKSLQQTGSEGTPSFHWLIQNQQTIKRLFDGHQYNNDSVKRN